jgi:cyclic beta-1,2-glucan synthetase
LRAGSNHLGEFAHAFVLTAAKLDISRPSGGPHIDAIGRTLYRLIASRKNLLEWTTAAQAGQITHPASSEIFVLCPSASLLELRQLPQAFYRTDSMWITILPFALSWFAAPAAAFWMSRSPKLEDELESSPVDRKTLRLVAPEDMAVFETFVTSEDSITASDNFRKTPNRWWRTALSTNIGLYLLSVASAHEFGWLGLSDAVGKIETTLATIKRMEKHHGHLYNWYDTTNLQPLEPKYVSTVDSGNLAGHLIALSNCCSSWMMQPGDVNASLDGIEDILDILSEDLVAIPNDRHILRPIRKHFESQVSALRRAIAKARETRNIFPCG